MAKIKVKLRDTSLRGESCHTTKWGHVSFDRDGYATLEVDEADVPALKALKWLHEPLKGLPEAVATPPAAPPPVETAEVGSDEPETLPKKTGRGSRK